MNNSSSVADLPESNFGAREREKIGTSDTEGVGPVEEISKSQNLKPKLDRKVSKITLTKPDELVEQAVTLVSQNEENELRRSVDETGELGTPVANLPPRSEGLQGEGSWSGLQFGPKSKESVQIDLSSTPEKNT